MEHQQEFSATVRNVNLVHSLIAQAKREGKKEIAITNYLSHTIDVLEAEGYETREEDLGYAKFLHIIFK